MQNIFIKNIILIIVVFVFFGCVSSEEIGAGDRAIKPVKTTTQKDSTVNNLSLNIKAINNVEANKTSVKFTSKHDTVKASIVTKSKSLSRPNITIERSKHSAYTVQLGAFAYAQNALRAQKKAKSRFKNYPVFNNYIKNHNMYRVSVGKFENKRDAFFFASTIKNKFNQDYKECWVNFISAK